jgi:hypothetical protein
MKTLIPLLLLFVLIAAGCSAVSTATDSGCAAPTEGKLLIEREEQGYCFTYPDNFDEFHPAPEATILMIDSLMNHTRPRLEVQIAAAEGRTAADAAGALIADNETAIPGLVLTRTALTLDGEEAIAVEPVPQQELARILFVVHEDGLYTLNFSPADPGGEEYAGMQALYDAVVASWRFMD